VNASSASTVSAAPIDEFGVQMLEKVAMRLMKMQLRIIFQQTLSNI